MLIYCHWHVSGRFWPFVVNKIYKYNISATERNIAQSKIVQKWSCYAFAVATFAVNRMHATAGAAGSVNVVRTYIML